MLVFGRVVVGGGSLMCFSCMFWLLLLSKVGCETPVLLWFHQLADPRKPIRRFLWIPVPHDILSWLTACNVSLSSLTAWSLEMLCNGAYVSLLLKLMKLRLESAFPSACCLSLFCFVCSGLPRMDSVGMAHSPFSGPKLFQDTWAKFTNKICN